MPESARRAHVVVVGAGFGGLSCARKLDGQPIDVTLLDQHNYHLFTPLLYQVATGLLNPSDIAYPLRTIFRRSANVRVRQATVVGVDLDGRSVHLEGAGAIAFDYLVLASGSIDNYFGNQHVADVSLGLKSLEEATRLRNHVLSCLERGDGETDEQVRREWLTFVVVGGGPTGVECSGAIGELMQIVAGKDYHHIARNEIRIVLVEALDRLLTTFSPRLGRYAARVLERRGIEVRTSMRVTAADDRSVTLSDGTVLPSRTIIWSAGVRPNDPTASAALPRLPNQRINVDERFRIPGAPHAFAIGDVGTPGAGQQLPMVSPPAMQAGRYVARSIIDEVRFNREPAGAFRYVDKGTMATIGRRAGIAALPGGIELTGFIGWVTWLVVHVYYLVGFRNRLVAIAAWAWDYVRFDRPIRIILRAAADREPA